MSIPFADSYLGQLRHLVGNRRLITPSCRAILRDDAGDVLLVRRSDNHTWVLPAGSMELGESVLDCCRREVKEETGLDVLSATPIAIYSEPRFHFTNAYGGMHQMLSVVFLVEKWSGTLKAETDETMDAQFFPLNALPEIPALYVEMLEDLREYKGTLILQ